MDRSDVVNAFAAFAALHEENTDLERRLRLRVREYVDVHAPYGRYPERGDVLDRLTPESFAGYFALVDRYLGRAEATRLSDEWARINAVDGVEIQVENSDDDPFQVMFTIRDPIANEWAEKHGSLDGGTWECADGPDFVYDIGYWHKDLFDGLKEYNLDFSQWSDPEESDFTIAEHAGHCDDCQGDFRQAEKHIAEGLEETAERKLAQQ